LKRRIKALKNMNFEEAMSCLEGQVKKLESGSMTLDESIASFEEAIKLIRVCNERLENAERRVRILTESSDGSITDLPFDLNDEA
jgi:exodeoxyribonuclease VII small subunit